MSTAINETVEHVAVPICLVWSTSLHPMLQSEKPSCRTFIQDLLSAQHEVFGIEVSHPCSTEAWASELSAVREAMEATAANKMPSRFRSCDAWDYSTVRKEHPLYTTSSHQIGCSAPRQHMMHDVWAGVRGGLSGLGTSQKVSIGFRTSLRSSKVHESIDGW